MEHVSSLCVYCGSSSRVAAAHKAAATALGTLIGQRGIRLVYGGGRVGLMGMIADAALAAGGEVIGVIPAFIDQYEVGHNGVTSLEIVSNMHERKARMVELSDGFVVLPGGLGTLDETLEIITWRQLGLHERPVVVVDVGGFWRPLRDLIEHVITEGYARQEHRSLLRFVDTVDAVLPALTGAPGPPVSIDAKWL